MTAEITTLADLGQLLRRLRRRQARRSGAKQLTYREIAERAGWSHGVVGEYFAGRVLPPTDRFDSLIRILGVTPAEQGALATARDRLEEDRRRATAPVRRGDPGPRDLPSPQHMFVARSAELARLDELMAGGRPIVISGMAGVGKTSLALHWAHRAGDAFPDGRLHVNLRGFHPEGVMATAEALRHLLGSLGVPGDRVPADTGAAERLYRTTLHGRRVLVVLDNVADAEHARPLLPPDGCLAVITSRHQLTGLVVAEGAHPLPLRPLDDHEARDLLARRLGAERIAGESTAAGRIITACGGLPLALAVVAARSAVNPSFPLADIAAQLDETAGGLDAMHSDDAGTDVRAAFSYSYHALPEAGRRMFRTLALHPGPEITEHAAAALTGTARAGARQELARLTRAQLLTENRPGRYAFHDLLRAYATELGEELDTTGDRRAARDRLIVHFVHAAHGAGLAINPFRTAMDLPPPGDPPATLPVYDDEAAGLAWFHAEIRVLLAVFELAVRTRKDREAWQLAWGMGEFLDRNGDWQEWVSVQTAALEAARRIGDRAAQAFSHRVAANGYLQLGRPYDAFAHLEQANDLYQELGNIARAANCLYLMAWACDLQDRGPAGVEYSERAIGLARRAEDPIILSFALNMAGHLLARLGDFRQALGKCEEALELQRKLDHKVGMSATLDTLGVAFHGLGRYDLAADHYREGIELHAELGDLYNEADMAVRLGSTYLARAETAAARDVWRRALRILEDLDHPDAAGVRERLDGLSDGVQSGPGSAAHGAG